MFEYSILKYHHSLALGEQINLGLLVSSDKEGIIEFLYPKHLKRLSALYSDIKVSFIRHYLSDFEKRARELTNNRSFHVFKDFNLEHIIKEYFLTPDSNALRFSEVKKVREIDYKRLKNYYFNTFLGEYEEKRTEKRKDEKYVIKRVKDYIHTYNPEVEKKLQRNIEVTNNEWGVREKFELGWKNGTLNLLTPLGFDLNDQDSIVKKATDWFGTLSFLNDVAKRENYSFDILSTRPTKKEFFSSYDYALKILDQLETPKNIYPEDDFDRYLDKMISDIV